MDCSPAPKPAWKPVIVTSTETHRIPCSIVKPPYILFWHKLTPISMQVSIHLASGFRGICTLCGNLPSPVLVSDHTTTRDKQMDQNGASSSVWRAIIAFWHPATAITLNNVLHRELDRYWWLWSSKQKLCQAAKIISFLLASSAIPLARLKLSFIQTSFCPKKRGAFLFSTSSKQCPHWGFSAD